MLQRCSLFSDIMCFLFFRYAWHLQVKQLSIPYLFDKNMAEGFKIYELVFNYSNKYAVIYLHQVIYSIEPIKIKLSLRDVMFLVIVCVFVAYNCCLCFDLFSFFLY